MDYEPYEGGGYEWIVQKRSRKVAGHFDSSCIQVYF